MEQNFIPFGLGLTPQNFAIVEVIFLDGTIGLCIFRADNMMFCPWDEDAECFLLSVFLNNILSWRETDK